MNTVFVFEDVLTDFVPGMVVLVARDLADSHRMLCQEFDYDIDSLLRWEPNFREPTAAYPTTGGYGDIRVVWGGHHKQRWSGVTTTWSEGGA